MQSIASNLALHNKIISLFLLSFFTLPTTMIWLSDIFPLRDSHFLVISLLSAIASVILFYRGKHTPAIALLFTAAFFVRLFMAHVDPFLHEWDERYHALVARNMMHHPFKPMLRINDAYSCDFTDWSCNHIWLHKQPLFLWQMALSMKIFGVSEFAIRYPAVLMGTIGVWLVYRIAFLATNDKATAFIAALLACFPFFHLQMLSGAEGTDQNDMAYNFYALCSIWAYTEYQGKRSIKYALLVGLFAGCAILNKWLIGTLVFSAWGLISLVNIRKNGARSEILHLITAIGVCVLVFLPWQLYILHAFPVEAKYELAYNGKHIWEVVEGHKGTNWFYYDYFPVYFGDYVWLLLPAGMIIALFVKNCHNSRVAALAIYFLLCFLFFTFVAQTKMYPYLMVVAPFGYFFMAIAITQIITWARAYKYLFIPVSLAVTFQLFNLSQITYLHDPKNNRDNWCNKAYNTSIYKNVKYRLSPNVKIIFNAKDQIDFMFYNNSIDAYGWVLPKETTNELIKKRVVMAIFGYTQRWELPECIAGYDSLYLIQDRFK